MKLIPFACPHCATALEQPRLRDHIVTCSACRQQLQLHPDGLLPQPVTYARPSVALDQVGEWLPFWVVRAAVELTGRSTQRTRKGEAAAAAELWSTPRQFTIPAYQLDFGQLRKVALKLLEAQPALTPLDAPPAGVLLPAAVLTAADAHEVADLLVVAVETRRSDLLRSLAYKIDVLETTFWALPWNRGRVLV
jgi:hypothetical protein